MTTIVLLPGLHGTPGLFDRFLEAQPEHIRAIAVSYPTQTSRSYAELRALVAEVLDEVEGPTLLVGESFSGPLALELASARPGGILGVVLVATFISAPYPRLLRWLPWGLGFRLVQTIFALGAAVGPARETTMLRSISGELRSVSAGVLADRVRAVFDVDASAALARCPSPILYLCALQDLVVPRRSLRRMLVLRPDMQVVEHRTGHFLLQAASAAAWESILAFEARLVPSAGDARLGG